MLNSSCLVTLMGIGDNINKLMEWYGMQDKWMQIKLSMLNENEKNANEYVNGQGNHPPLACILT